jgi:glycosyltransferase involved in cell wall biosynthesis
VLSNAVAINFNKYLAFPLENQLTTLRISVIIPAYNEERCIGLTLENIFRMKYPNFEVIVVDDGSTDGTSEIAKRYPIKYIKIKHSGPAAAKNAGIKEATGELIVIHDANDLILDEKFLNKIAYSYLFFNREANVVLMPIAMIPRKDGILNKAMFIRDYLAFKPKVMNSTFSVTVINPVAFRRDSIYYDEKLGTFEDIFIHIDENSKAILVSESSIKAIDGAMDSIRGMISRWIWGGKSLLPVLQRSRMLFLLIAGYGVYTVILTITFIMSILSNLQYLILGLPFIMREVIRFINSLRYSHHIIISLLIPCLDYLQGFCYFIGLVKAVVLLLLGKYSAAR